ncbi:MAG: hypothetical protein ACRD68_15995 [Pyrinomonadaceae bacterium]
MPRQKKNINDETVRRMIEHHLRRRVQTAPAARRGGHLDEDTLAAFVEGSLSQPETAPLITHLVACTSCRHATAQLIRLESEMGEAEIVQPAAQPEPGRIRRLLETLAARVLPESGEDAVFAYHAPAEDFEKDEGQGDKRAGGAEGPSSNKPDEPAKKPAPGAKE